MDAKCLTIAGLVLDIAGVVIVWRFGWPQPTLETGVSLGLEDNTPIGPSGETVTDHNKKIGARRTWYRRMAIAGLLLILVGFGLQIVAQLA